MPAFHFVEGLDAVPDGVRGGLVAIGNFDGVHLGHQQVLLRLRDTARSLGVPAIVLTFEPHPRDVFAPAPFMFRLTDADAKRRIIEALGLDGLVVMPFTRDFSQVEAEDFIARYLRDALAVRGVVVGADFHFGRARRGTPAFLAAAGREQGFDVEILDLVDEADDHVSSTRVREALRAGKVGLANRLLGYHWFFSGIVEHGDQRGRELGFPTANLAMPRQRELAQGVYAVRARLGEQLLDGVASFGKPMFDNTTPPFEVNLFDFSASIYGERLDVALIGRLRGQMIFSGLDELIAAIGRDAGAARDMLPKANPLGDLDRALGFFRP